MLNVEAVSTGSALRVDAAAADLDTLAAELGGLGSRMETLKAKVSRSGGEKSGAGAKAKPEANPDHVDDHTPEKPADPILMHVVVRADLVPGLGWPVGSVVTQACHATVAAIAQYANAPLTQQYLADLEGMRKVSVEVKNEAALLKLAGALETAGVDHHLWIEQPEGIPTALATAPRYKSTVPKALKKCKLFKNPVYPTESP